METLTLKVGGMTCMGCVSSVQRVLQAVAGVSAVDVSLEAGQAVITFDESSASRVQLAAAIEDAGYEVSA